MEQPNKSEKGNELFGYVEKQSYWNAWNKILVLLAEQPFLLRKCIGKELFDMILDQLHNDNSDWQTTSLLQSTFLYKRCDLA